MLRILLPVALSLGATLLFTACPEPSEGEGEGEGEGEEGEGEGEGNGETCAEARILAEGTPESGDTAGTADDVTLGCNYDPGAAGDLFYRFTLDADASVTLDLDTELDLSLALFNAAACDEAAQVECTDVSLDVEQISVGYLPPGDYFVAIDGNNGIEGAFTITLTTGAPVCEGDGYDAVGGEGGNETPATAGNLGGANLDTATIDADTSTPEIDAIDLHQCAGDVDYWLVMHLGGGLDVSVTTNAGESGSVTGELFLAAIDEAASLEAGGPVVTGESGAAIPLATAATDLAGGYYLLKVTESGAALTDPVGYQFAFEHDCEPDAADSPIAALDDETSVLGANGLRITDDVLADAAYALNSCGGNDDAFVVEAITSGTATVTLTGGGPLTATVTFIADGTTTEVAAAGVVAAVASGNQTLTFSALEDTGIYVVRLSEAVPSASTIAYTITADFTYDPAPNDTCANAAALAAGETQQVIRGNNMVAGSELVGLCNGDADVNMTEAPEDIGTDVFYSLNIATQTNLELRLADAGGGYSGTMTVYSFVDEVCPTDLSTLPAIKTDGTVFNPATDDAADACAYDRLRIANIPAGDYLVAVDGSAGMVVIIFYLPPSKGAFDLKSQTFAAGFPPAEACSEATAITLPASGASLDVPVAFADWSTDSELKGSCGGTGQERVFTFTPAATGNVTFTTAVDGPDTVLYVRSAACEAAAPVEAGCNDDNGAGGLWSSVTAAVTAGTEYFVVVDNYSTLAATDDPNDTTLTVAVE